MDRACKDFKRFREKLYRGDELYAGSAEFVTDMLLGKTTDFAERCVIVPISTERAGERTAQCLWIYAPRTEYAQIAFFDAIDGASAEELLDKARALTRQRGLHRLVAGLHGHLSYGVGILTSAQSKNTFDTCYNKMHYGAYFSDFPTVHTLSAYRGELSDVRKRFCAAPEDTGEYTVRAADFAHFEEECERMRVLCDATIGQTYLYAPTEKGHFYQLLKDMKILLSGRNLLFLSYRGEDVGFLFWHPDYNAAVPPGKPCSAFSFACRYALHRKAIDTVKLNSVGVCDAHRGKGTLALLRAFDEAIGNRYRYVETNFVWDNNRKSTLLNKRLLGEVCRTFAVYEETV